MVVTADEIEVRQRNKEQMEEGKDMREAAGRVGGGCQSVARL